MIETRESAMDIRVCALKLWLLLHITAWTLQPCSSREIYVDEIRSPSVAGYAQPGGYNGVTSPENAVSWESWRMDREQKYLEYYNRKYFYMHNETQIAMARVAADAARHDSGGAATSNGASPLLNIQVSGTFPDFPPSEDGCNWKSAHRDLSFYGGISAWSTRSYDRMEILAVDSCAGRRNIILGSSFELCSHRWVKPEKPDILIRDNPDPLTHSFNVLVDIRLQEKRRFAEKVILADGVYFPATGKMHLVGCTRKERFPDYELPRIRPNYSVPARPPILVPQILQHYEVTSPEMMNLSLEVPPELPLELPLLSVTPVALEHPPWIDPDTYHQPPLNSSIPEDCAIALTVQYPPLNSRWNKDRVLKYDIRSKREKDDPLYFEPIEQSAFFPYDGRYFEVHEFGDEIPLLRRLETGARILLLVLGLVCLALQIEHGRNNEESLPFVSLVMLGIQLGNHLSQTSIFKDLQIGAYLGEWRGSHNNVNGGSNVHSFPGSRSEQYEYDYYQIMAWSEHVPYQAMAMAAIFMYVWIFHRVGDRRRIMKLRVLRKRPNAKEPPSDWRVMYATLAFFSLLCFLGFFVIGADQHGDLRRALTGMTAEQERFNGDQGGGYGVEWMQAFNYGLSPTVAPVGELDFELMHEAQTSSPFISWRFYELSHSQWSFVNKLTELVVSFFLVPQLLGNMQWEVQGRPLSAWFYVGISFLQSLPHVFSIAKHFQLLPIFSCYDPYFNPFYGIYENPTPWWQIVVVVFSTLQLTMEHFGERDMLNFVNSIACCAALVISVLICVLF